MIWESAIYTTFKRRVNGIHAVISLDKKTSLHVTRKSLRKNSKLKLMNNGNLVKSKERRKMRKNRKRRIRM